MNSHGQTLWKVIFVLAIVSIVGFFGRRVATSQICSTWPQSQQVSGVSSARWIPRRIRQFSSHENMQPALSKRPSRISRRPCNFWVVITTIHSPSAVVSAFRCPKGLKSCAWCICVVADMKTDPREWEKLEREWENLVYLSPEKQKELNFAIEPLVPWNHFARKNLGYLYAMRQGALAIYDTDDDNFLRNADRMEACATGSADGWAMHPLCRWAYYLANRSGTRPMPELQVVAPSFHNHSTSCPVVNPYPHFYPSEQGTWPRGYPLEEIQRRKQCGEGMQTKIVSAIDLFNAVGVVQTLANVDPDVDAVHRLTKTLPMHFQRDNNFALLVGKQSFAPFNAQATLFARKSFWSMLLPSTVHGRVSDIWRSYFSQAIMRCSGMTVAFVSPWVDQLRNSHDFLGDFVAETPLYEKSGALVSFLLANSCSTLEKKELPLQAMLNLYKDLYEIGVVEEKDVTLASAWTKDLVSIFGDGISADVRAEPPSSPQSQVLFVSKGSSLTAGEVGEALHFAPPAEKLNSSIAFRYRTMSSSWGMSAENVEFWIDEEDYSSNNTICPSCILQGSFSRAVAAWYNLTELGAKAPPWIVRGHGLGGFIIASTCSMDFGWRFFFKRYPAGTIPFKWIFFGDDDTFVFTSNMATFLGQYDSSKLVFAGPSECNMIKTYNDRQVCGFSTAYGMVMSRALMEKLREKWDGVGVMGAVRAYGIAPNSWGDDTAMNHEVHQVDGLIVVVDPGFGNGTFTKHLRNMKEKEFTMRVAEETKKLHVK